MKRNGHQPGQCDGQHNRCAGLPRFAARPDRGSWWLLMIRGGSIVARSAAPSLPHLLRLESQRGRSHPTTIAAFPSPCNWRQTSVQRALERDWEQRPQM